MVGQVRLGHQSVAGGGHEGFEAPGSHSAIQLQETLRSRSDSSSQADLTYLHVPGCGLTHEALAVPMLLNGQLWSGNKLPLRRGTNSHAHTNLNGQNGHL